MVGPLTTLLLTGRPTRVGSATGDGGRSGREAVTAGVRLLLNPSKPPLTSYWPRSLASFASSGRMHSMISRLKVRRAVRMRPLHLFGLCAELVVVR